MNKIILLLVLLFPLLAVGKDYQVKLHVQNLPAGSKPLLLKVYNGNLYVIDSLAILENNTIQFRVPADTRPGMLQAVLGFSTYARYSGGQPTGIDFLFNKEDIELDLDFEKPVESIKVIQSKENRIYFDFLAADAIFFKKMGLLIQVVTNYPEQDDFYRKAQEYYKKHHVQRNKLIDKTYSQNTQSLAGRVIHTKKMPFVEGNATPSIRDSLFKAHLLESMVLDDTTLLYTNVYTDKVYQFIQIHMKRNASPRENEAAIIQALDVLIPRLDANPVTQQAMLQFLINGFEANNLEEVLAHISTHYLQQCGGSQDIVKRRLKGYQKMAVGGTVPDFTLMDINNNPVNLYSMISPYRLIVFWHTECSHCKLLMEDLPKLAEEFKKHQIQIIGISIDTDDDVWKKFSAEHPMDWTNIRIDNGFDNEVSAAYNLFATPSMFLIDANNTIVAKPTTIQELKKNTFEL